MPASTGRRTWKSCGKLWAAPGESLMQGASHQKMAQGLKKGGPSYQSPPEWPATQQQHLWAVKPEPHPAFRAAPQLSGHRKTEQGAQEANHDPSLGPFTRHPS